MDCFDGKAKEYIEKEIRSVLKLTTADLETRPVAVAKIIEERVWGKKSGSVSSYQQKVLHSIISTSLHSCGCNTNFVYLTTSNSIQNRGTSFVLQTEQSSTIVQPITSQSKLLLDLQRCVMFTREICGSTSAPMPLVKSPNLKYCQVSALQSDGSCKGKEKKLTPMVIYTLLLKQSGELV